jgi:hypothetical protein
MDSNSKVVNKKIISYNLSIYLFKKLFTFFNYDLTLLLNIIVVENQTTNLIPNNLFGYNLCFKFSNKKCDPILNI